MIHQSSRSTLMQQGDLYTPSQITAQHLKTRVNVGNHAFLQRAPHPSHRLAFDPSAHIRPESDVVKCAPLTGCVAVGASPTPNSHPPPEGVAARGAKNYGRRAKLRISNPTKYNGRPYESGGGGARCASAGLTRVPPIVRRNATPVKKPTGGSLKGRPCLTLP